MFGFFSSLFMISAGVSHHGALRLVLPAKRRRQRLSVPQWLVNLTECRKHGISNNKFAVIAADSPLNAIKEFYSLRLPNLNLCFPSGFPCVAPLAPLI